MYALVMSYDCVPAERAILESHRVHADVQMTIAGAERIEVFPSSEQEVKDAYLAERDVTFYRRGRQPAAVAEQRPGWVCLLLPEDAHSPQLAIPGERAWVKKAVVKVPVSELGWAARG
jgi:YhcH/YjgK/YiaL family protein